MVINVKITRAVNAEHFKVPIGHVVTMDIEKDYLPSVVASEIYESNSRTPFEAKKAQAITARTYALAHAKAGNTIDDTSNYQSFSWKPIETISQCAEAVLQTQGQVLSCKGNIITAWFTAANGGRTRRSDESWKTSTPWTQSIEDKWDVGGRLKWGNPSSYGHGVGMSQIGASFAAYSDIDYCDILHFYYPNTDIVSDYGNGSVLYLFREKNIGGDSVSDKIPVQSLVNYFMSAVGSGYAWGASGEKCTQSFLDELVRRLDPVRDAGTIKNLKTICPKWIGKNVWDCSGLFRGAWKSLLKAKSGGATTIFNTWCSETGIRGTLPEEPGIALFRGTVDAKGKGNMAHIGLYIGNGEVVEARGSAKGVLHCAITDGGWTHWGRLTDVAYSGYIAAQQANPIYQAKTKDIKTSKGLDLRPAPSLNSNAIMYIPLDAFVDVFEDNCGIDGNFAYVRYCGIFGYCTRTYLMRLLEHEVQENDIDEDIVPILPIPDSTVDESANGLQSLSFNLQVYLESENILKASIPISPGDSVAIAKFARDLEPITVYYSTMQSDGTLKEINV